MIAIEATNIKKSFGKKEAIKNISLKINKGSIHAILGPNGSGKTTFIKICTTLMEQNGGSVSIFGFDTIKDGSKVRNLISLTGQSASMDDDMTGFENLFLIAKLLGFSNSLAKKRAKDLLISFGLKEASNKLVKYYSGGMRRRLDLAASIVRVPDILFLDEPTTGLDPRSRNSLWEIIRKLAKLNTTVLLTTQNLEEADQLADRITVIDQGEVIAEGTSEELKSSIGNNILHVYLNEYPDKERLETIFSDIEYNIPKDGNNKGISIPAKNYNQAITILGKMDAEGLNIKGFHLSRPNLDEVFLALTGKKQDENSNDEIKNEFSSGMNNELILPENPLNRSGIITHKLMFGWRNLLKIKHVPEQFLDVLITPVMFTFMFTYIFGGAIAGATSDYLQYLIPGILVQTLTFNAMYAGMNIHTDISKGIFDRFRSMPVWPPSPLAGIFIGDFLRHLIAGLIVLLFAYILGYKISAGLAGISISFALMISFSMSISWIFIIFGLILRSTSAVMSIGWLLLMPVVFMSNIYVDPVTMPVWLQTFVAYNPLAWQVDAVRSLLEGNFSFELIRNAFSATVIISLILAPIAVWLYKKER